MGAAAFEGCSALESVTIPEGVTSIGEWAFSECSSLSTIVIPDSVTKIPRLAFYGCSSLESAVIPKSVTTIEESAFEGCGALLSAEIPESVTSIGKNAFYGCGALESIVIPDSVEIIGRSAFEGCESLKNVKVPENAPKQIGIFAFGVDFDGSDNDVAVVVDDNLLILANEPYIKDGRTLVPMRAIFEALGCSVEWNDEDKSVIAVSELGYVIKLTIGEATMYVDGRAVELDAAAEIKNDCTFVPVRAISEALECEVDWDADNRIVEITLWWMI